MDLATCTKDIHICGTCKQSFNDLNLFIEHKRSQCFDSTLDNVNSQPLLELVTTNSTDDTMGHSLVGLHPLYRVGLNLEGGHLTAEQETRLILQHLRSQGISGSLILRSRLLGSNPEQLITEERTEPTVNLDSTNNVNLIHEMQNEQSRRELQMDEEDVASLLANQLANDVACGINPSTDTSFGGELLSRASIAREDSDSPEPRNMFSSESTEIQRDHSCENLDQDESFNPPQLPQDQYIMSEVDLDHENLACQNDSAELGLQESLAPLDQSLIDRSLPRLKKQHCCSVVGCGFASCYLKDLARHMRKHTGERPFRCTTCSHMFTRADKLKAHQRIHEGIKTHVCTLCKYAAIDANSLRKHMLVHNDKKPYKCQMCAYRSRTSSQLTVHLRTHTGDTPFVCPHVSCSGAFKTSSDLVRHSRLHSGEKPYVCNACDYACNIKSNLKVHIRLNHTQYTPVPCTVCKHVPTSKLAAREHSKLHARNLKRHIRSKHPGAPIKSGKSSERGLPQSKESKNAAASRLLCKKTYQCSVCSAAFVREDSWRSHLRQHKVLDSTSSEDSVEQLSRDSVEQLSRDSAEQLSREAMDMDEIEEATKYISPHAISTLGDETNHSEEDSDIMLHQMKPAPQEHSPNIVESLGRDQDDDALAVIQDPPLPLSRDSPPPHPLYVYVTEGVPEGELRAGELMTTPMVFSSPCGQYMTLPSQSGMVEQLSVSLQGGMQFVLSGSLASLVGSDTFVEKEALATTEVFRRKDTILASETFVQSSNSINFIETDLSHQNNSPSASQALEFRAKETSVKKF